MSACSGGPKRRGPQNYRQYRAENDPRWAGDSDDGDATLSSDDGEFGPTSGTLSVLASDLIRGGKVPQSGRLKGTIKYSGKATKAKTIDVSKDGWCNSKHTVINESLVVDGAGGLKNVFVFVSKGFNRFSFEPPSEAALLDQSGCKYIPHVLTLMAGQELKVRNSDHTSHNYNFTTRANDAFNRTQAEPKTDIVDTLVTAELGATFRCDIHPWMVAPTFIMAHPYFAVTDEMGNFEIKGLPPGNYEISFIHERSDMNCAAQTVIIAAGQEVTLAANFQR